MTTISIQRTLENKTFEEVAIERLREHEPPGKPYRLAFSGGKDSIVIKHLADRAGVRYESHFSQTTIDPPEVVRFIREYYPDVIWDRPKRTMFKIIEEEKVLPTRTMRFCCRELKEMGNKEGGITVTGVRWEESPRRRTRQPYEKSKYLRNVWFVHPIIEWSSKDVWNYIRRYKLPYCSLYDEGYNRIGCIMCPLQGEKGMRRDAARFPAVYRRYLKSIRRVLESGEANRFWAGRTAEEIMEWWIMEKWESSTRRETP